MKTDRTVLVAVIILIVLVAWLLVLSMNNQKHNNSASTTGIEMELKSLQDKINNLPKPTNGTTPILGVDYYNGVNGQSIQGAKGDTIQGPTGATGAIGPTGLSNYELATKNGYRGTEQEYLASLVPKPPTIDISCLSGIVGTRLSTDDLWQATNIKCEATHD